MLCSLTFLVNGCEEKGVEIKPEIHLIATPGPVGLTTDILTFDARQTMNPPGGGELYFRWNFGEDSEWDSQMSKDPVKSKRFMKPGHYEVTVYAINSKGFSDTVIYQVDINLGRSAPRPVIRMEPETGHFLTQFRLNARLTRDDEDSLNTLKFRWDYNGDGTWETGFDTIPEGSYVFGAEGNYEPIVEVEDPTGLKAIGFTRVTVTSVDPEILPDFSWTPATGEVGDTILFDASLSRHLTNDTAAFKYCWRLEEGEGWTLPADTPTISHRFRTNRKQEVILKVTDARGLFNTTIKEIYLDPENFPPTANFDVSSRFGNIRTQFRLSAWSCTDDHDTVGKLLVRWDFDGDEIWDTGYSIEKLLFHQYQSAGDYDLTLEAKDSKGLTARFSRQVLVSPWENETGILEDKRDMQFYGTVKIGERWWMAENLRYDFRSELAPFEMMFPSLPLFENPANVETYGRFYFVRDAVPNRTGPDETDYVHPICPSGWSIPTKEEWEQLIADTHTEEEPENLLVGGKSDFNATYMGYVDYYFIYEGYKSGPKDTVFSFKETYQKAWFFSSTQPKDPNRSDLFMFNIDRAGPGFWMGWENLNYYIPVRCIKGK